MKKQKLLAENLTPTHKRVGAPLDDFMSNHPADRTLTLAESEKLLTTLSALAPDTERELADDLFRWGLCAASTLADRGGDSRELVEDLVSNLAVGVAHMVNEAICAAIEGERRKMANLPQYGDAVAKVEAQQQARQLWANDADEEWRVGEAAKMIQAHLENKGLGTYTEKTVRDWIKETAPAYARKGGRPKKAQ